MHKPVLLAETISALHIENQAWYVDATVGAAGHTIEILKNGGNVLGIDADEKMLEVARKRIEEACPSPDSCRGRFKLVQGNFRDLQAMVEANLDEPVKGILFDLGISMLHYQQSQRGFSFAKADEPLDMRLDPKVQQVTAADMVNALREDQLHTIFESAMDYRDARFFAKTIVNGRESKRIATVGDLLRLLPAKRVGKTHPATKVFMALRMAVNTELENIEPGIAQAIEILHPGGILAVITFHSTEDKLVKHLFLQNENKLKTFVAVSPTSQEVESNPSSRSAKLRVAQKI